MQTHSLNVVVILLKQCEIGVNVFSAYCICLFLNTEETVCGNQHHTTDAVHKNSPEYSCKKGNMNITIFQKLNITTDCGLLAETEEQADHLNQKGKTMILHQCHTGLSFWALWTDSRCSAVMRLASESIPFESVCVNGCCLKLHSCIKNKFSQ